LIAVRYAFALAAFDFDKSKVFQLAYGILRIVAGATKLLDEEVM